MPKKPKVDPQDLEDFYAAIKGAKPLTHNKIRLPPPIKKPVKHTSPPEEIFHLNESTRVAAVKSEEFITYKQTSISDKILRKLRKGQYNVEAILDLHGMTVDKARTAVESFLLQCLRKEIRVALIIHGKGHHSPVPVLKNKLNNWLREINTVLAFCSAAEMHGSRGAIYVLLKHITEEPSHE